MSDFINNGNDAHSLKVPDANYDVKETFGLDLDMEVPGFSEDSEYVPKLDPDYQFDHDTTLAILAGFAFNRRVMIQGYHGTGKSTHIEQVAAKLNWPCLRINLDSHISRIDLIGKDAIVLKDGKQVTEFKEGLLPWALRNPVALVFDEYDAGRADVMFVIQRVLEVDGKVMKLKSEELHNPNMFALCCLDQANIVVASVQPRDWRQVILKELLENLQEIKPLESLNHDNQLENLLYDFTLLINSSGLSIISLYH